MRYGSGDHFMRALGINLEFRMSPRFFLFYTLLRCTVEANPLSKLFRSSVTDHQTTGLFTCFLRFSLNLPLAENLKKLVPQLSDATNSIHLEARSLAAPLFFRLTNGFNNDPRDDFDQSLAVVASQLPVLPDNDFSYNETDSAASSTSFNQANDGSKSTMSGLATSTVQDSGSNNPSNPPYGDFQISMNSTSSIQSQVSGAIQLANGMAVNTRSMRTYVLADDSITPISSQIVEYASIHYVAGCPTVNNVSAFAGGGSGDGRGLSILIGGDASGITAVNISGVGVPLFSSGTFTNQAGTVVSYSSSSTEVTATSRTSLPALQTAVRGNNGDVQGLQWVVEVNSAMNSGFQFQANGMSSMATHYDAHFE